MDINTFRGIATISCALALAGIAIWAYSKSRKTSFDEAANLPFADDTPATKPDKKYKNVSDQQNSGEIE